MTTRAEPVDREVADLDQVRARWRRPSQHRSDAGQQLVVDDGPRQVVVRAALERAHPVDGVRLLRTEHDHRDIAVPGPARLALAEARAEVELGADDEVGTRPLGERERLAAERGLEHVEAVTRQLALEVSPRGGLRLGEQQRGCHASKLATGFRSRKMSFRTTLRRSFPSRLFGPALLATALLGLAAGGRATAWERHTPLPEPRTEVSAAAAGGEIVVAGGFVAAGGNSARVDAYSVKDDRWRRLPDLPVSVDHAAAASANGRVYVVGGYGGDRLPLRTVFVLERGAWRALARLPDARAAAAAAIAGGKLYVVGGIDGRRSLARVAFALTLGSQTLDEDPWPERAGAPRRRRLGWARLRDRRPRGRDRHEQDATSRSTTPPPSAGAGSHRCRERAAARARRRSAGASSRSAARSRPARSEASTPTTWRTRRWSRLPDLPTPRHGLGVVAVNDRIWVVGGGPEPGLTVSGAVESLKP